MSGPKNNIFQFCEDEKHTKNFVGTHFNHFHIYEDRKHILALKLLIKVFVYL